MKYLVLALTILAVSACAELDQLANDMNDSLAYKGSEAVDTSMYLTPEDVNLDKKELNNTKGHEVIGYIACSGDRCNLHDRVGAHNIVDGSSISVNQSHLDRDARKYLLNCGGMSTSCRVVVGGEIKVNSINVPMLVADSLKIL